MVVLLRTKIDRRDVACCQAVLRDFQHHWLEGTAPLHLRPFHSFPTSLCVCVHIQSRPCSSCNAVLVAAPHLSFRHLSFVVTTLVNKHDKWIVCMFGIRLLEITRDVPS